MITQENILQSLIKAGQEKAQNIYIQEVVVGKSLVAIKNSLGQAGLAAFFPGSTPPNLVSTPLIDILPWLEKQNTLKASLALAALNSLLFPENYLTQKAQEILLQQGQNKNLAVIGHFPFVEKFRPYFKNLWVLELHPRPGDLPANKAKEILPRAEIVALTATTLLNGTLASLLNLIPANSLKLMLGPSTPLSNYLFTLNFHYLGGARVLDFELVRQGILKGACFKQLTGVTSILISKENSH